MTGPRETAGHVIKKLSNHEENLPNEEETGELTKEARVSASFTREI